MQMVMTRKRLLLGSFILTVALASLVFFGAGYASLDYLRYRMGISPDRGGAFRLVRSSKYRARVIEILENEDNPWVREEFYSAERSLRPDDLQAVTWGLHNDPDSFLRCSCLRTLVRAAPESKEYLAEIIAAVGNTELSVQLYALQYLEKLMGEDLANLQVILSRDDLYVSPEAQEIWERWWQDNRDKQICDDTAEKFRVQER